MPRRLLALALAFALAGCTSPSPSSPLADCRPLAAAGDAYWSAQVELITAQRASLKAALSGQADPALTDRATLASVANQKASAAWDEARTALGRKCPQVAAAALPVQGALLTAMTVGTDAAPDVVAAADLAADEARKKWEQVTPR